MSSEAQILLLAKRVKQLREAAGKSQQLLAQEADIDKKTLQNLEMGRSNPSLKILIAIAQALEVQVKDLFDF